MPDHSLLVVEMGPERGGITHIAADGQTKRVIAKTGRPNGLAVDRNGVIWVAESRSRALLRLTMDGKSEVVATGCEGEPFLFPNDLCFASDGALYLTDSGIQHDDWARNWKDRDDYFNARVDGRVYRVQPNSGIVTKIDSGMGFPNGIAFGPGNSLYVNETLTGTVNRYNERHGVISGRENFGNVIDPKGPKVFKGPDGMAFCRDGRLFVTVYGQGNVTVLGQDGGVVQRIRTAGRRPTNVAFGAPGEKRIYVTEVELGQIEFFDVDVDGLPLHG